MLYFYPGNLTPESELHNATAVTLNMVAILS